MRVYSAAMSAVFAAAYIGEVVNTGSLLYRFPFALLTIVFIVTSLRHSRGFQLTVSLVFLTVGHLLLLYYGTDAAQWYGHITRGMVLPVLLVALPLLVFPIQEGGYLSSVARLLSGMKGRPVLLFPLLALSHLALSIALNIGSIPTMQTIIREANLPPKYLSRIYTAGYASYMVFSPFDGIINMVLVMTSVAYARYVPGALAMVLLIVTVSLLLVRFDRPLTREMAGESKTGTGGGNRIEVEGEPSGRENDGGGENPAGGESAESLATTEKRRGAGELLLHIVLLIIGAILVTVAGPFSSPIYGVAAVLTGYSAFWLFLTKPDLSSSALQARWREYRGYLTGYAGIIVFLVSASFLGSVVTSTPLSEIIAGFVEYIAGLPQYVLILSFMLMTTGLSLVGVHMMIPVTVFAMTVQPELLGLSAPSFALMLLSCWYLAMSVTPFVPFAVIVGQSLQMRPITVTWRYNVSFSLLLHLSAPLLILAVNAFY